jgi:hypothetical protein
MTEEEAARELCSAIEPLLAGLVVEAGLHDPNNPGHRCPPWSPPRWSVLLCLRGILVICWVTSDRSVSWMPNMEALYGDLVTELLALLPAAIPPAEAP